MNITIPNINSANWEIQFSARGVSLKGNTQQKHLPEFLLYYDFTREIFGPPLSLPFHSFNEDTVTLSSVRDEQLTVLFERDDTLQMEIWITTKIEPETASWSKLFLAVGMEPLTGLQFQVAAGNFFVDEEKKVVVFLDKDTETRERYIAFITHVSVLMFQV
ncbi:unnamed protein product [Arabidopsis thaliana]|uniref:F-box associated beta-propeller type 1 domain-containing protein n=1 Tax=Arabidopsis thaliana TaxID=3702 RepID=A0A5S9XD86_ARATH|nr:unnamed protein product [Arabidopsis thaliana]